MSFLGNDREQHKKEAQQMEKKRAQIRESFTTGKLESGLAMKKNQEENSEDLLDVKQAKHDLRKALLGKELQVRKYETDDGDIVEKPVWIDISEKQLCNQKGFDMIWSQVEGFLNKNVTGSYLPAYTIENMCKGTLKTVIKQVKTHHEEYGIDNREDASEIIDIVRTALIANMNKARGGRGLKSKEKTVVEKITRALDSDEDDEKGSGGMPNPFSN